MPAGIAVDRHKPSETNEANGTTETSKRQIDMTFTELRKITSRDAEGNAVEHEFEFLVVTEASKWLPASRYTSEFKMNIPGSNRVLRFPMYGISYGQWADIEFKNPIPSPPTNEDTGEEEPQDAEYLNDKADAIFRKRVALYEIALNKTIPGETIEDKVTWLRELPSGDIDCVFIAVHNVAAAMQDSGLLGKLDECTSGKNRIETTIDFADFTSWKTATETTSVFRVHHHGDNCIIEFPLRSVSQKQKDEIDRETKKPEPPKRYKRDSTTGRLDTKRFDYNYSDPIFQRNLTAVNQKRLVMIFEAALTFAIPGATQHEKYCWLADRLQGDVNRLELFIEGSLMSYGDRFNAFTSG